MQRTRHVEKKVESKEWLTATTMICDQCKRESHDDGEMKFGGCVHGGWLSVDKRISITSRIHGSEHHWDFCSEECMKDHFTKAKHA